MGPNAAYPRQPPDDGTSTVGLVGCGRMGLPMIRRLVGAGMAVRAFDVSEAALDEAIAAGAAKVSSPREAAHGAQVVITMLPDPVTVAGAATGEDGVVCGLVRGALWLEMTSSSPQVTARLAEEAHQVGAQLLDAPVSGGVRGAEEGSLTVMLGGSAALVDRARPVLSRLGRQLLHVGDRPGDGDIAKTLNNMLSATNLVAAGEALAVGMRAGLDPARLVDCINAGSGASQASTVKLTEHVLTGRFAAGFTIAQYLKDLRIALGLAADEDVAVPVNAAARAVWTAHTARGSAEADHTRIPDLVVRDAGLNPEWAARPVHEEDRP